MTGRLFIRTEASSQVGMGHFMRCFAIAEAARGQGIDVTFLLNTVDRPVARRCASIGAKAEAVADFGADITDMPSRLTPEDWLLIDSYKATADYVSALHIITRVAVIDDLDVFDSYDCDLIINPAMAAPHASYVAKSSARLLLGAKYALIRQEFRQAPHPVDGAAVSIMFGGSDPNRLTGGCAQAVRKALPGVAIRLIAGPAHIHADELRAQADADANMQLFVDPPSVAEVLAGSLFVITAAGGSIGEVAAMGLPALVLVVYDNQKAALDACPFPAIDARTGLPADLGWQVKGLLDDPAQRQAIAATAHKIVDGRGAARVVDAMFGSADV